MVLIDLLRVLRDLLRVVLRDLLKDLLRVVLMDLLMLINGGNLPGLPLAGLLHLLRVALFTLLPLLILVLILRMRVMMEVIDDGVKQ